MKTETLFLLAGGAAALLWFMDQQQSSPAPAASSPAPAPAAQPAQPPASPPTSPAGLPVIPPANPPMGTIDLTPASSNAPLTRGGVRVKYSADPLEVPSSVTQRVNRTPIQTGGISGLALYGGWGR